VTAAIVGLEGRNAIHERDAKLDHSMRGLRVSRFRVSSSRVRHLIDQIRERLQGEFIQNEVGCAGTKVRE